ncbi:transposase domain-containing protein [Actinopolymorpha pittospori]|uniref:transposase domain-containing protein n=1 Tax=Actinopolymorpha pittospori TaxID=648752 RepID=UPI003B58AD7D
MWPEGETLSTPSGACGRLGEGYEEVMRRLVGGLMFLKNWSKDWSVPTTSAITQARARLGEEPLKELFHRVVLRDSGCVTFLVVAR